MVESRKGSAARVEAQFVVDGYPEDFVFRLGPVEQRLRNGHGVAKLKLSARKLEVLDFAYQTCRGATLNVSAKVSGRTGNASGALRLAPDCAEPD